VPTGCWLARKRTRQKLRAALSILPLTELCSTHIGKSNNERACLKTVRRSRDCVGTTPHDAGTSCQGCREVVRCQRTTSLVAVDHGLSRICAR